MWTEYLNLKKRKFEIVKKFLRNEWFFPHDLTRDKELFFDKKMHFWREITDPIQSWHFSWEITDRFESKDFVFWPNKSTWIYYWNTKKRKFEIVKKFLRNEGFFPHDLTRYEEMFFGFHSFAVGL